jgi:hypothetical protein
MTGFSETVDRQMLNNLMPFGVRNLLYLPFPILFVPTGFCIGITCAAVLSMIDKYCTIALELFQMCKGHEINIMLITTRL